MLGSFRKASQSWPARILFGFLVIMFVVWGIGDVMRLRADNKPAIEIGDLKIAPETVAEQFRRDAEMLQRQSGGKITVDDARKMGLLNQTVQRLVTQGLLDEEGERLGLAVDDGTVRRQIAEIPAFRNQLNKFDPNLYRETLSNNGYTETRFEAMERQDIRRAELTQAIASGAAVPDALLDPIFRYRDERRTAELIAYQAKDMPAPPAPDDAALQTYLKDHAAAFTAPEMRALTAIVVRAADLVADFKPPEDQIAKTYQDRQAEFTTEESRHIRQVFFSDRASAQKMVDAVKGGKSFDEAAKDAGKTADDLGTVTRKSLPIESLAAAAFAADAPGVAGPVQTPLGWNVLYVVGKTPSKVLPLDEVRGKIVDYLKKDEGSTRLNALSTKLEDSIGSGATIEEAASSLNLKLLKIPAVDSNGDGPDGKPAAGVPDDPAFLSDAFAAAKGAASEVTQLEKEDGYFVLRVDAIAPPAVKPYQAVKDQVKAAWILDRQRQEATRTAMLAVQRLDQGDAPAAVAGTAGKASETKPFERGGDEAVPGQVASIAFKLQPGKAGVAAVEDTVYAVRLKAIVPADPKADAAARDKLQDQLANGIAGDLSAEYIQALAKDLDLRVNQGVIEQQFSQQQ